MRITSLRIQNLRAIELLEIHDLKDFVIVAGPNGCGKTTVLDAVRLIKSIYVHNEWRLWFGEFGINIDQPGNLSHIFRDANQSAQLNATVRLSEDEHEFLLNHADNIAKSIFLNRLQNQRFARTVTGDPPLHIDSLPKSQISQVEHDANVLSSSLKQALRTGLEFSAGLQMLAHPPQVVPINSPVATAAFTTFRPESLGEIEFHTSRRNYVRESVDNIRLRVGDRAEERRNRFLYDLENKYKNVKTQLGEEYIASILKGENPEEAPLQKSIKDLFEIFFPGKEFKGVTLGKDNSLQFPVMLSTGEIHDIDELSSGEKEIVYGYLWLRTGTPRQSIVLVDEPELHLNPALVHGLPGFYKTNLADALDSQVWIVTHSDAILRQAVRDPEMSVFHMARAFDNTQQANLINTQDAIEAAVIDLIGDLAAYRPYAKIVLVEGQNDTRFDVEVIRRLFPAIAERANFIPAGNRRMTSGIRVRLLQILEEAGLTGRAVSISDYDLGKGPNTEKYGHFRWPVYEIENFLLDPKIIRAAAKTFLRNDPFDSDEEVIERLRTIANGIVDHLALIEIQEALNDEFIRSISISGGGVDPRNSLKKSALGAQKRISKIDISEARINQMFDESSTRFRGYLESLEFLTKFPGERLMSGLAGDFHITTEHFKNACLDQAHRHKFCPKEMENILLEAIR